MILFLFVLLGLIIGSFLGAQTYRYTRGISNLSGRSFCDSCGKKILWFDNIPVLSFMLLGGLSRCCGKKISWRYPLIEIFTGVIFSMYYLYTFDYSLIAVFHLVFFAVLISVLVIDFENYIIPDPQSYFLTLLATVAILIGEEKISIYNHFYAGFVVSNILLFLHLITKKKGMGLGDVKLALPIGIILGLPMAFLWLLTSFVIGATVGLILIIFGKESLKSAVPFGPFLIVSFFIVFFFGPLVRQLILPIY